MKESDFEYATRILSALSFEKEKMRLRIKNILRDKNTENSVFVEKLHSKIEEYRNNDMVEDISDWFIDYYAKKDNRKNQTKQDFRKAMKHFAKSEILLKHIFRNWTDYQFRQKQLSGKESRKISEHHLKKYRNTVYKWIPIEIEKYFDENEIPNKYISPIYSNGSKKDIDC
ncbi:hypothetical protein CL614_08375 [archaeon]|nr:hypothetical protein [archaeon]